MIKREIGCGSGKMRERKKDELERSDEGDKYFAMLPKDIYVASLESLRESQFSFSANNFKIHL